ncbi:MAG: aspartate kinase [Bergeyella sp.]|nr:aspartate kinase [Bergeyella sp.]
MRVYKFGGASISDASGVINLAEIVKTQFFFTGILVISAMGKTTNALEEIVSEYCGGRDYVPGLEKIKQNHLSVAGELFPENKNGMRRISRFFEELKEFLAEEHKNRDYNFLYDQVVSVGERVSSSMVSIYLEEEGYKNKWLDVRNFIKTDSTYREGVVDWSRTEEEIKKLAGDTLYVTQGFLGSDKNDFTVTLGREGSDYTAAIFSSVLNAKEATIWKDVPGVMTGDPKKFSDPEVLPYISYEEALEMAYYGASVIHEKTLQPLKQKNIPLYVKSFSEPEKQGTKISDSDKSKKKTMYILKENQILLRLKTRDFSFVTEESINTLFSVLAREKMRVHLMQSSAISFVVCIEDKYGNIENTINILEKIFSVEVIKSVSLLTVRDGATKDVGNLFPGGRVLLEQVFRDVRQIVYRNFV